ncbi:MAG TPA: hypothetical protein VF450_11680 [Noviherbaspirillum sp.]
MHIAVAGEELSQAAQPVAKTDNDAMTERYPTTLRKASPGEAAAIHDLWEQVRRDCGEPD